MRLTIDIEPRDIVAFWTVGWCPWLLLMPKPKPKAREASRASLGGGFNE